MKAIGRSTSVLRWIDIPKLASLVDLQAKALEATVNAVFGRYSQRHNLRWNAIPDMVWSPGQVPETSYPLFLIALLPDVEERP